VYTADNHCRQGRCTVALRYCHRQPAQSKVTILAGHGFKTGSRQQSLKTLLHGVATTQAGNRLVLRQFAGAGEEDARLTDESGQRRGQRSGGNIVIAHAIVGLLRLRHRRQRRCNDQRADADQL